MVISVNSYRLTYAGAQIRTSSCSFSNRNGKRRNQVNGTFEKGTPTLFDFSIFFFRAFAVYKEQFPERIFLGLPFNLWGLPRRAQQRNKFEYRTELFDMNKREGYLLDFII